MSYFGNAFDFNNDGMLDTLESALEFGVFMQVMDHEKNENLIDAGLDPQELDDMDYFERREILENAGFDPDDFDF